MSLSSSHTGPRFSYQSPLSPYTVGSHRRWVGHLWLRSLSLEIPPFWAPPAPYSKALDVNVLRGGVRAELRRGPSQGLCIGQGPWAPAICQASEKELCPYLGAETGSSLSASGVSGGRLAEHSEPGAFPPLGGRVYGRTAQSPREVGGAHAPPRQLSSGRTALNLKCSYFFFPVSSLFCPATSSSPSCCHK